MFDKFWGAKSAAAKQETTPPPNKKMEMPSNLRRPESNPVKRDAKGEIISFDKSFPTIPLKAAREYVAMQHERLAKELMDARESGMPTDVISRKVEEQAAQTAELKKLEDMIDERMKQPDAKEAVYAGKELSIANPYFEMSKVGVPEMAPANDNAEAGSNAEQLAKELEGMRASREALLRKQKDLKGRTDVLMMQLKGKDIAAQEVGKLAAAMKRPEYYPVMNDVGADDRMAAEARKLAEAASKDKRESGIGDELRDVLDQADDVKEALTVLEGNIERKQTNLTFLQKRSGEHREAA